MVVGPNGAGKSTALSLLYSLRLGFERGFDASLGFFGSGRLKHYDASDGEAIRVSVQLGSAKWALIIRDTALVAEELTEENTPGSFTHHATSVAPWHFSVRPGGPIIGLPRRPGFALDALCSHPSGPASAPNLMRLRASVLKSGLFRMPELEALRESGSPSGNDSALEIRARNLFTVLRNWHGQSDHEHRIQFVERWMSECFPREFRRFDFSQIAQRTTAFALTPRADKTKLAPTDWSDGFLCVLSRLAAVASVDSADVVTIDEPENALHPKLIAMLIEALKEWSTSYGTRIVVATHSPVLLDQFHEEPERILVMDSNAEENPTPLDAIKKRDWLRNFSLGDLYSHLEVGAPTP